MPHIFVSHASEDKAAFVRPLAHALKAHGLRLWYDEFSLRPGDSLRRSIDRGLAECSAGLLVLSPSFFSKEWPQRELDGLFAAEIAGQSRLIPIWYQIDFSGVAARSPLMADRLALSADLGVEEIAKRIAELHPPPPRVSGVDLAQRLENFKHFGLFAGEALLAGCWYRFLQMNAFKEEYQEASEELTSPLSDEEIECWPKELDERLQSEQQRLSLKYRLSPDVYLTIDEPVRESEFSWWRDSLASWSSGTMSSKESAQLVHALDLDELDEYYILLEVPNFHISGSQRNLLERALIELGCGYEDEWKKLDGLCNALRAE
jgi:hypothetical protein